MNKRQLLQLYLKNQGQVYRRILAEGTNFIAEDDICSILQTETELPYNEVILKGFTEDQIYVMVRQNIQSNGLALATLRPLMDDNDIDWLFLDDDTLEKAMVQHKGVVWVIHQNDVDPHPSLPHAHNYVAGTKLDLYNGNIYRKKQLIGKMKAKEFEALLAKIKNNYPNITFKNAE